MNPKQMKKLFILLAMLPLLLAAEEKPDSLWTTNGSATLNFTQISLSNWAAGGKSSMSGVALLNWSANYKKDKLSWENSFDFRYGFIKEEDEKHRKSDDKIDINTKLGIEAGKNWHYTGLMNFKSQFAKGYSLADENDYISKFMAPAYLTVGIGMDYKTEKFSALLSPVSGKFTIVTDDRLSDEGAFGVDPGKKLRSELGATAKFSFKTEIMKNVSLDTNLDLFSNYIDQPKNVDVDWKVRIDMRINEYLSALLTTQLIYDNDVKIQGEDPSGLPAPAIQFMESFGVGLAFKF